MARSQLTFLTALVLFFMMTPEDMDWADSSVVPRVSPNMRRKKRKVVAQCRECSYVARNEVKLPKFL